MATMYQFKHGNSHSLAKYIGTVNGEATGVLTAGITLVSLQSLDQNQLSLFVEQGRIDRVIGQVTAAVIGVVTDKDIARPPIVLLVIFQTQRTASGETNSNCGMPTDIPASRPLASIILALRSLD